MNRRHMVLAAGLFMCGAKSASAQEAPFVKDVVRRINAERGKQKLSRLSYNAKLEAAAQGHAEWMARNRKMEHLQPAPHSLEEHRTCSHHPVNRAIKAGYLSWDDVFREKPSPNGRVVVAGPHANHNVGEIIAAAWNGGHPGSQTRRIVAGWMASPKHHDEIMTGHNEELGVGVATTPNGKDTFWCVVFGTPLDP